MAPDTNKDDQLQPKEAVRIPIMSHDEPETPSVPEAPKDGLANLNESVHPAVNTQTTASAPPAAPNPVTLQSPASVTLATTTTATPVADGMFNGGIVSGSNTSAPVTFDPAKKRRFGKRSVFASALSILLVVGLSAGYVFGYYIPNKPENVWAAAMGNSGKAYDMLTEYATKDKGVKAIQVDGSYKLSGPVASDASFSGSTNNKEGQLTGTFSAAGLKVGLDLRALQSSTDTPDVYFKLTGLQGLGKLAGGSNPEIAQAIGGLNNQWFVIDHSLFDQVSGAASKTKFTQKDIQEFLKAVGAPTKDRLFSSDSTKAVFVVKETIGAETKDGRNTYHYKVGYDAKNLAAYAKALCTSVRSTKIGELLFQSQGEKACEEAASAEVPVSKDTADVWVDKRTKLIHVVRFTSDKSYVELSQDYQGGDEMPFGLKVHTEPSEDQSSRNNPLSPYEGAIAPPTNAGGQADVEVKATLNTAKNTLDISGNFSAELGAGDKKQTGEFSLSIKPSDKTELQIDKPKNAKNILELLDSLGLGGVFGPTGSTGGGLGSAGMQATAQDTERRTDLALITSHLYEYMTNHSGQVPTLAQLNNATWLKQNMPTLSKEALRDPQGSSYQLAASPKAKQYAFVSGCTGSAACRDFSVVAILSDGKQYKVAN